MMRSVNFETLKFSVSGIPAIAASLNFSFGSVPARPVPVTDHVIQELGLRDISHVNDAPFILFMITNRLRISLSVINA